MDWIRTASNTLVMYVPGKLSEREQDRFRRRFRVRGSYSFIYSPRTGRTTVTVKEW